MSRNRFGVLGAVLLVLLLSLTPMVDATERTVTNGEATYTVAEESHDAWKFTVGDGQVFDFEVKVTDGSNIDFYLLNPSDYGKYKSLTAFGYEKSEEKTKSWDDKFDDEGTFYLVVDNDDVSQSGASPTGDVAYTVDFEVRDKTLKERIIDFLWILLGVVLVLVYIGSKFMRS